MTATTTAIFATRPRLAGRKSNVRESWKPFHFLTALFLVLVAIAVTSDAWADILSIALKDEESSHVLLAPIVVAWLVWARRARFRYLRRRGNWFGCVMVLVGWLLYSTGDSYWIQAFWHAGAVLIAVGAVVTVTGWEVLKEFLPAFVAVFFVIPIPGRLRQQIAMPLQSVTASITQHLLDLFGIVTDRSGDLLSINGVGVTIAEACNGLRMISSLGLVLFAFVFGTTLRLYVRFLLLLATPIAAVIFNVLRLLPTVWVYGNCSTAFADRFHAISGWAMLFGSFFFLLGLLQLLRWAMLPVATFRLAYD